MSRKAAKTDKPKGRGGKREGAGRKPTHGVKMDTRSVTLPPDMWGMIDSCAKSMGVSYSEVIRLRMTPPNVMCVLSTGSQSA